MAVRVLVIEDSESAGSLLSRYLDGHIVRVANDPATLGAHGEPHGEAAGQHAHLRVPGWGQYEHADFDVKLLPLDQLRLLVSTAAKRETLEHELARICTRSFEGISAVPDVMLVDLALSDKETEDLGNAGGDDEPKPHAPNQPLRDPRSALELLAGFKIVKQFGGQVPVIATSYARNPLVAQHCLMNGAFAVIRKPLAGHNAKVEEDHLGYDMKTAAKMSIIELETQGLQNRGSLGIVANHYLSLAAAEILKALHPGAVRSVRRLYHGALPPDVERAFGTSGEREPPEVPE